MAGAASSIESTPGPGGGGSPLTSIAIVQWTHTLRMQNALLLARQQVLRTRIEAELQPKLAWGHHVLLQSCGKARAEEEADCRSMTLSLASRGLTENVSCYTSVAMGDALPALANIRNVFEHRGPHAANLTVGSYRWCWHSCDGATSPFTRLSASGFANTTTSGSLSGRRVDRRAAKHLGRVESEHPIHPGLCARRIAPRFLGQVLDAHRRRDATSEGKGRAQAVRQVQGRYARNGRSPLARR